MKRKTKLLPVLLMIAMSFYSCDESEDSSQFKEIFFTDDLTNQGFIGDNYQESEENPFVNVADQSVSTFSIDADGASYANARRFILEDQSIPPKGAIRTEEFINYFDLDYAFNTSDHPVDVHGEVSSCPWNEAHQLLRIGIQGKPMDTESIASNYVFLIDVSGSMASEDKLELLKNGFKSVLDELSANDRVAIVTYAGADEVILESTSADDKNVISSAIDRLGAGGGTAGAQGIVTAYEIASQNFIEGGNNRIILGTDGDFNIGTSSTEELVKLIEEKRESGVFITAIGVGRGNLNDNGLEQIANNGNGTYEYVDNIKQLKKVFLYDFNKFFTVAKDVKVQIEFSSDNVAAYRLIGYENRVLANDDFDDDEEDAGEIGADQNITALYEIIPSDVTISSEEFAKIDFRYKAPDSDTSIPFEIEVKNSTTAFESSSDQMQFTSAVAAFSLLIRNSEYKGSSTYGQILDWLNMTNLSDPYGFKEELKTLVSRVDGMN